VLLPIQVWEAIFTKAPKSGSMIGRRKGGRLMRCDAMRCDAPCAAVHCAAITTPPPFAGDGEAGTLGYEAKLRVLIGQNSEYDKIAKGMPGTPHGPQRARRCARRSCTVLYTYASRLAAGCYENYLLIPYRDPSMTATTRVLDWLLFFDDLNTSAMRHQNFSAMAYMQYPILGVSGAASPRPVFRLVVTRPSSNHSVPHALLDVRGRRQHQVPAGPRRGMLC
jgi:hypothetical protein